MLRDATISQQDTGAQRLKFKLKARINRPDARAIRQALDQLDARGSVRKECDEFLFEAQMQGATARN